MITFNKSDFDTILEYAKKNLPEEACGLSPHKCGCQQRTFFHGSKRTI